LLSYLTAIETGVASVIIIGIGLAGSSWAAGRLLRRGAPPASIRSARVAITVIAVLIALTVAFVWIGPISLVTGLTFSAIVGLGITLALQTTLGNIIAGFILLQDRMLRLNDTITISGVTGRVVRIGVITVWVRMDDGSLATMSNSTLLGGPMINRSVKERLKGEY
jgi:small-conductance mechanosensitive channel